LVFRPIGLIGLISLIGLIEASVEKRPRSGVVPGRGGVGEAVSADCRWCL